MTISQLVQHLINCRIAHYNNKDIVDNNEFDKLEQRLRDIDPNNSYFDQVGTPFLSDGAIKFNHKVPMLSMDKVQPKDTIEKWYNHCKINSDTEMLLGLKYDGIAGALHYSNRDIILGVTRGNGECGEVIPWANSNIKDIFPTTINFSDDIEIRGEFIINKKYNSTIFEGAPLRNVAAGIVRGGKNLEYLSFIAYQVVGINFEKEIDVIKFLKELGFNTIDNPVILNSSEKIRQFYNNYIKSVRDLFDYETDGIVVTINDKKLQSVVNSKNKIRTFNHYNIAIKPPSKYGSSKIIDLIFSVSKNGRIVPVVLYEPIKIDNVEIQKATLNNYTFLKSFGRFYVGNTVYVKRANDVIPNVISMDEDGDMTKPLVMSETICPCCGSEVRIVVTPKSGIENIYCTNNECSGKNISIIQYWVDRFDMKNVGEKFIEAAYNSGIVTDIIDLYKPNLLSELNTLDNFKEGGLKLAKIIASIEKTKINVDDISIMRAIGIGGVGESVLKNLKLYDIDTLQNDINREDVRDSAICIHIRDWLTPKNYKRLKDLKMIMDSKSPKVIISDGPKVCITGSFDVKRSDIEHALVCRGYRIADSVTSSTNILLVGENAGSKLLKAEKLGIVILKYNDLF